MSMSIERLELYLFPKLGYNLGETALKKAPLVRNALQNGHLI